MDARTDLRLVEIRNEPRLRAIGCETTAFIYRISQKAEALWRYLTRRHKRRRPRRARASRDTIKDRASIHDRPKTIESRGEAGHWEATSSSANAHGLCSSCMSVSHGSPLPRGSQENRRRNHLSDACRCSAASILICEDRSLSTMTPPSPSTACSGLCAT